MFKRAGFIYVYVGSRGSHHQFRNPDTGDKHTIAGNPSKELGKDSWESVQAILRSRERQS